MAYTVAAFLFLATFLIGNRLTCAVSSLTEAPDTKRCTVGTVYKSSLPAGGTGVEQLTVLGTGMAADQCISKCCSLGPGGCQYLWVLEGTCIAVACESAKMSSCKPMTVAATKTSSVYVLMDHPKQESSDLENALDWVKDVMHGGSKGGKKESGDSPPIAATPTDEIIITSPNNEVYIYGNNSKDDKGISSYSWKLLTEHFVQPILENTDQAILHVRNLIPGIYQFSLRVTDTTGQSSRTTVLVRVNKGPTELTTGGVPPHTPTVTTTTASPSSQQSESSTALLDTTTGSEGGNDTASVEDQDMEKFYTKRRNVLKIVIPVLLSLAVLLVATAAITTACACCCERNKHRMKRYYRYRKLPETIEKT